VTNSAVVTSAAEDQSARSNRDRRAELLAAAGRGALVALADRAIEAEVPLLVSGPEVGMVMLQVREPVCEERFYLGEVLVTRAEVELRGTRGWAMRMGEDREATLAAALLDAEVESCGPLTDEVLDMLATVADRLRRERAADWAELAPTEVRFDGLD
jgi:alpha-D-ribose 1-methylphosphonate 5-triphosphate synthase subunit PhnG